MSSLGYLSETRRVIVRKKKETNIPSLPVPETFHQTSRRTMYLSLIIFNSLLALGHITLAIIISTFDITFPFTITENTLKSVVIEKFKCSYDHTNRVDTGEPYCTDISKRTTNASCLQSDPFTSPGSGPSIVSDLSMLTIDNETGSPLLDSYEISQVNASESGKFLAKWILFSIAALTAIFHVIYAITFYNAMKEEKQRTSRILDFVLSFGGLPSRWTEYSLSASLMSLFAGNVSNVFDVNALAAFALGTYALMYYGQLIEYYAFNGLLETSLMLFYVPSMALFALTWLPLVRSATSDALLRFLCNDEQPSLFCAQPTCFGSDNPIPLFILVLGLLFCVFPLIESVKVFGLYREKSKNCVDLSCAYLWFAFIYGPFVAVKRLVYNVLFPLTLNPSMIERQRHIQRNQKINVILRGEFAFAFASATSKYFLFIFFLITFASRNW